MTQSSSESEKDAIKSSPGNPSSNALGSELTAGHIESAIQLSGYPLQTITGKLFRECQFRVQEEWSYNDRNTGDIRTVDILAQGLYIGQNIDDYIDKSLKPTLNLIVECKQSKLPYLFFLSEDSPGIRRFPLIAGLKSEDMRIELHNDLHMTRPIVEALSLHRHPFVKYDVTCSTFSKCVRKGSNLELSGSDAYNSLIMPLVSALLHFVTRSAPPNPTPDHYTYDARLVLALGVLDAPMIGVKVTPESHDMEMVPWVRVIRHEPLERAHPYSFAGRFFAIDVVHKDFLGDYLKQHVAPLANTFEQLAYGHSVELISLHGTIAGTSASWNDPEQGLAPHNQEQSE